MGMEFGLGDVIFIFNGAEFDQEFGVGVVNVFPFGEVAGPRVGVF